MRIRAQMGMVMALDKCIGCHTCSVTCKQVWTNRPGAEYMWFNDVETKPGVGYPKRWEDQEHWRGGWEHVPAPASQNFDSMATTSASPSIRASSWVGRGSPSVWISTSLPRFQRTDLGPCLGYASCIITAIS